MIDRWLWIYLDQYFGKDDCYFFTSRMEKAVGDIEQNLPSGSTFADSVKNKRVYMIDLSFMANVECAEPIPGAVALFHVADNGDLMPIAIQLSPDEDAPVSTYVQWSKWPSVFVGTLLCVSKITSKLFAMAPSNLT